MKTRKEIIRPGEYTYINPNTNRPEVLRVTPDHIKHFHESGNAMLQSGLSIPVPVEHQPEAKPQTPAERAAKQLLNNAGFVEKFEVDNGRLFGVLDIADERIAEKLPTSIKWTSPWINSFTDGNGKQWDGVISHLALTTRPRITQQEPFPSIDAAMSIATTPTKTPNGFALSRAGRLKKVGGKLTPEFPIAFSMLAGAKLSDEEIEEAFEEDDAETPPPVSDSDSDGADMPPPPPEMPTAAEEVAAEQVDSDDIAVEELIAHMLDMHGIPMPSNVRGRDFLRQLVQVLLNSAKAMVKEPLLPETNGVSAPGDQPSKPSPIRQENPPMYMSLEEITKKVGNVEMARAMFSLQEENRKNRSKIESVEKKQLSDATAIRNARITKVGSVMPAKDRDELIRQAANAPLSIVDGVISDPLDVMLSLLESAWGAQILSVSLSTATVVSHPVDGGAMNAARRDEIMKGMGVPAAK